MPTMTTTQQSAPCQRGDVVLVLFPHSDLRTATLRPALVVQADDLNTGMALVTLGMITSRIQRGSHPCRVVIKRSSPAGRRSGLLTYSLVMTDNLATVRLSAIDRVVGRLAMENVDRALRHTLGLW